MVTHVKYVPCPRCLGNSTVIFCALCHERREVTLYLKRNYEKSNKSIEACLEIRNKMKERQ